MGTTALPTLPHSTTTHPKSNHGLYLCYLDHRVDYQHLERRCELRFGDDPGQVRRVEEGGQQGDCEGQHQRLDRRPHLCRCRRHWQQGRRVEARGLQDECTALIGFHASTPSPPSREVVPLL